MNKNNCNKISLKHSNELQLLESGSLKTIFKLFFMFKYYLIFFLKIFKNSLNKFIFINIFYYFIVKSFPSFKYVSIQILLISKIFFNKKIIQN
jgi:hypothetical protein